MLLIFSLNLLLPLLPLTTPDPAAVVILANSGIKGGLVVHLGCGDGLLTAGLHANDRYLVQGLDADPANVEKARVSLRNKGLYGPVTIAPWTGKHLPYADNIVNLLVVSGPVPVEKDEIMRVLAPQGVALFLSPDTPPQITSKLLKPRPGEMDEWTHWFHGPDGNNVSRDQLVGPPRKLQWTAGPFWARHHALPNTVSVAVSSGGRLFYVLDQSPTSILAGVPDRWGLVACDAFSGVELWRRPMSAWGRAAWGENFYTDPAKQLQHFWKVPSDAQRRMVADGDRLFMPLGYREPISVLDGATGETLHIFKGSEDSQLVVRAGNLVYLAGGGKKEIPEITAYDAQTFQPVWSKNKQEIASVVDLAVRNGQALLLEREALIALDTATGKQLWKNQEATVPKRGKFNRLVLTDSMALVLDDKDNLLAFSIKDGAYKWTYPMKRMVHRNLDEPLGSHLELYVVGDTVWASSGLATMAGLNLTTGAAGKTIDATAVLTSPHHHRCYTDRATERFMIIGKENVEFVGFDQPLQQVCNWIRGTCRFGLLPANGMLYVPPSACTCYMNIMLRGFNALTAGHEPLPANYEPLLERGSAYETAGTEPANGPGDWPTYRHDGSRSGVTSQTLPSALVKAWQLDLKGRLTPPVVAQNRVLVADVDRHAVHCWEAASGKPNWTYTAGGRVDSPPTIAGPRVLFGCRDGWVYCLRLVDGALIWRLRAAPAERQIVANGQLESSWPLHGSMLVENGVAYAAAGRATRLDGGLRLLAIEPVTGRVLHQAVFDTPERTTPLKDNRDPEERTGFVSDILVADADGFWMRTEKFTSQLQGESVGFKGGTGGGGMSPTGGVTGLPHLTAVSGFLDDQYFDRVYWGYEGVFGQMLVVTGKMVYGVRAYDHTGFGLSYKLGSGYLLFGESHEGQKPKNPPPTKFKDPGENATQKDSEPTLTEQTIARPHPLPSNLWTQRCDLRVRGLALADQMLVLAGPLDKVDAKDPYAAFEGRGPAKLRLASVADGQTISEINLDAPPVWDGLAVANGKLYLVTTDGQISCYTGK